MTKNEFISLCARNFAVALRESNGVQSFPARLAIESAMEFAENLEKRGVAPWDENPIAPPIFKATAGIASPTALSLIFRDMSGKIPLGVVIPAGDFDVIVAKSDGKIIKPAIDKINSLL